MLFQKRVSPFNCLKMGGLLAFVAVAYVNHRVHPADTLDDVIRRNKVYIDDKRVKIETVNSLPPAPVSGMTFWLAFLCWDKSLTSLNRLRNKRFQGLEVYNQRNLS